AAALEPEPARDLGHARPRRLGRRQRPTMVVELGVLLASQREQRDDLVHLLLRDRDRLVERLPERVEQRVERVPVLWPHRGRSAGDRIASRIPSLPVSPIASRSMPTPQPPVGGIPYASAST